MLLRRLVLGFSAAADGIRRADTAGLSVVFQLVRRLVIARRLRRKIALIDYSRGVSRENKLSCLLVKGFTMKMWMRNGMVLSAVALLVCAVAPAYGDEEKEKAEGEKASVETPAIECPVSGRPVQTDLSEEYKDGKVYFCCPGCVEKFKSDSKPFAEAADAQLKAIAAGAKVNQFACPMCSKPHMTAVKRPVKKGLLGVKLANVYFCSDDCATAFEKEDDKAATEKLESVLTSQTACPFTGKPIDVEVSAEHNGTKIFFCCKDCVKEFEKDKDGTLAKLKEGAGFASGGKGEKEEKGTEEAESKEQEEEKD